MFAVGNFAAKVPMPMAPAQQPPGFFGGPRVATPHVSVFEPPKYEFLKSECNSGTSSTEHSAGETFTKTEDLTDEILEGAADLFDLVGSKFFSHIFNFMNSFKIVYALVTFSGSIQVFLRDGRLIMGELASVDHFHNLVIFGAAERIIIGKQYADMPRQVEVIRGDNLIMIGEIV